MSIHDRNQPTDERDRAIEAREFRVAVLSESAHDVTPVVSDRLGG